MIKIYIDVYNVLPREPNIGITQVVRDVARACLAFVDGPRNDSEVRLYGGWYEGTNQTKTAQLLSATIDGQFPAVEKSAGISRGITTSKISAQMAVAMESSPHELLCDTFRSKSPDWRIRVRSSEEFSCSRDDCFLGLLRSTLRKKRCKIDGCDRPIIDVLYRAEQKMVDTMMTCDLMGQITNHDDLIVVVSDDTDFFPPIRCLVDAGVCVVWVVTQGENPYRRRLEQNSNFRTIHI